MMAHHFTTGKISRQSKGVAGPRICNDPPHTAPPHLSPDQASVPCNKGLFASGFSPSQPDIKINSSIAINVTDLKHKITGLEQQLSEVNKHCRELVYLESSSRKESQTLVPTVRDELGSLKEETEIATSRRTSRTETKVLYKTSESHYRKSDESDSYEKVYDDSHDKRDMSLQGTVIEEHVPKKRKTKKKSKFDDRLYTINGSQPNLGKRGTQTVLERLPSSYSTNSYHSLVETKRNYYEKSHPTYHKEKQYRHREYGDRLPPKVMKPKRHKEHVKNLQTEIPMEIKHKSKSKRKVSRDIDQDFIAEIIKRQYKPMKMFKRESEISQFSAPVCRDQEYPVRKEVQHGSELCSCCCDGRKKYRYEYEHELSDLHSICDTRLYSSKKLMRHGHPKKHVDMYNDSELYDLIPVKEKASPKIRRKPAADEITPLTYYKEVPPSPRTLRPRLNLKAQHYTEYEDYMMHRKHPYRNDSPKKSRKYLEQFYNIESETVSTDITECVKQKRKTQTCGKNKGNQNHQDAGTMSSLQTPASNNDNNVNITNDTSFNKTQETISSDKTDKALSEIKDILQSFLLEIKKETVVSQSDNSGLSTKRGDKSFNEFHKDSAKINTPVMPNSGHSVNKFSVPQCPMPSYMPSFTNPCCYPILPVCPMNCVQNPMNCVQNPMNCLQNGYVLPSTSFTCASCANNNKDDFYPKNANIPNEFPNNNKCTTETDELIKEIYKFVAQSPVNDRRKENVPGTNFTEGKVLTSRSVGGSSKASRHDAKVGTQKIRCYSKSCEAIGSRMTSDTYYSRTNPTYSDTVLERLSLEATASESEFSSESTVVKKEKPGRFAKVLKSFGLFKKKKDVIEELSESESTVEVDIKPKSPYRQELTDYVVHGEEYYNRPPMPPFHQPHHSPYTSAHDYQGYGTPEYPRFPGHLSPTPPSIYDNYYPYKFPPEHGTASPFLSKRQQPSAPPYQNPFESHHNPNQPPLCLKEIEVKSIATQSERKMSFFRKLTKKVQGPAVTHRNEIDGARTCSTQTAARVAPAPIKASKLAKFNWKTLQAKMNELDQPENMTFSLKTQKKLAEGDIKMRNAMLKKLFYKRNPFSPRNLIVKTLLGKDRSSYGEPPVMYRPKMFF